VHTNKKEVPDFLRENYMWSEQSMLRIKFYVPLRELYQQNETTKSVSSTEH
jgi:hypothetical protein